MASDEHSRYRVLPVAICAAASALAFAFLGTRFLHKKRGQHGNCCPMKQQLQLQELDGSHNVPSTSSSIDPETGHEFEVFLSFRGSDTRKMFTDYLYHSLTDAGIRTFKDIEELRVGEEIGPKLMKSVKQSKIAIPIFSKDYASSKWCLKEVEEMVKCMKETRQHIIPIFVDVTPDEVQHQTGSYAYAFAQHEKRFSLETVRGWRDALAEVAQLKGLELCTVANGEQGKLIKLIVMRVIRQLKKSHLEVNNILVGIEDRAEELLNRLRVDIEDSRVVGVWGMGGIGKTTLAKFVYNQIVDNFEGSSILDNIRETSKSPRGLQHLQSKLASDILRHDQEDFTNIKEGIVVLKERLSDKKALILLDDVDHINQLEALAGDAEWFGRGSRIIITTREKVVLDQYQVQDLYEVELMDEDQALELFCQHAFSDKFPRIGFVEMAREIVNITGRLPLALKVIGSHLSSYGGRKDEWKKIVEKLKIKPDMDVHHKLKISYESLDHCEKEIFLDIACFFIGMDVRLVIPMWNDLHFFPTVGIEVLLKKSLIKIEEDNTIWMHDQLRDLGRYIVEQENFKEPGLRSRLWRSEDVVNVLVEKQESSKVEAICLEHFELADGMLKNASRLRFLDLNDVRLHGNFQQPFFALRWFGWHTEDEPPLENLIPNHLTVLDLSRSVSTWNWIGWSSNKTWVKLKVLNLRNCRISRTHDFSAFPSLEILILASCEDLVLVDPSIGLLKHLILLDLRKCLRLQALPKELGSLESLVELLIDYTNVEEIPISGGMKKLEILSANNCQKLKEIPASIISLKNLKGLHLEGCRFTQTLPELPSGLISLKVGGPFLDSKVEPKDDCLSKLKELKKLHLTTVRLSTLPKEMSSFLHLEEVYISYCEELKCIPRLPSSLSVLRIHCCDSLWRLPDLSNLKNLSTLEVNECYKIEEIKGFGDLLSLKILSIQDCPSVKLDGLERLEFLNEIRFRGSQVERMPDLSKLKSLQRLDLSYNDKLVEIQNLSSLKKLKELIMLDCMSLEFLGELPDCLERLDLSVCMRLCKLPNLSKLQRLKHLIMINCYEIVEIPGLEELSNLRELDVQGCDKLKLPNLAQSVAQSVNADYKWAAYRKLLARNPRYRL